MTRVAVYDGASVESPQDFSYTNVSLKAHRPWWQERNEKAPRRRDHGAEETHMPTMQGGRAIRTRRPVAVWEMGTSQTAIDPLLMWRAQSISARPCVKFRWIMWFCAPRRHIESQRSAPKVTNSRKS